MNLLEAAAERRAGYPSRAARPAERRMAEGASGGRRGAVRVALDPTEVREEQRNGLTVVRVGGYASVTETPYEMWDMFGVYTETVSRGAFGKTLASQPQVEFNLNHGRSGAASMASTENGMLDLAEDEIGLRFDAYPDPQRSDVRDMLLALERRDLTGASFRFMITRGQWSPDYTEYRIDEVDIDRGDVSSVNFGASPAAWSELREQQPAARRALPVVSRFIPDDPWTRDRV